MENTRKSLFSIALFALLPVFLQAQNENWVYRYQGTGNDDMAYSIAYGLDNNIYAAGFSDALGTNYDFIVVSLTNMGDTNWIYRYNGPGNGYDEAYAIVCGEDGNIYAAGRSYGAGTYDDFIVISLTPGGDTNWVYRYNGPANGVDIAYAIVYGEDGNIYVGGASTGDNLLYDFTVISLTTAGDTNWTYKYNGPGDSWDWANALVYGDDGKIYAAGSTVSSGSNLDFTVISLTSSGSVDWVYRYNGPNNYYDEANSIIFGADTSIYAAGYSYGNATFEDFIVISLTVTGDTNWVYRYNGPGNDYDKAHSLERDAQGNIYVAGTSWSSNTGDDLTVISITTNGDTNWVYRYNGLGNGRDTGLSLVYGADSHVYVAGTSDRGGFEYIDLVVIKLTLNANTSWVYHYNGPGNAADIAYSIINGDDGNIYTAGASNNVSNNYDLVVISIDPSLGVQENNTVLQNHTSWATIFSGSSPFFKNPDYRIFDITGRQINGINPPPGVYFIQTDNQQIHKVVKIR